MADLAVTTVGTLQRLTDSIEAQLPGVLDPVVQMAVYDTAEDFCIRSGYWRKVVSWTLTQGSASVQLLPGETDAVLQRVVEVYGLSAYYVQQPDTLVYNGPGTAQQTTGTALVTLKPQSIGGVPGFIIQTWFETLRDGAMARLYAQPTKPYTNLDLSKLFSERYEQGIVRATMEASRAVGNAPFGPDPGLDRLYTSIETTIDVPHSLVQIAAWNTIEEFFIRSTWRREHLFWQMPAGVAAVDFNPFDANWLVAWILQVTGLSQPKIEPPGLLRDVQYPVSTSLRNGEVILALKPASFTSDFGVLLWQQWFETILDGTLWRLYRMPGKPWSGPQLAQMHGQAYRAGTNRARAFADANADGTGRGSWVFPYFSIGRRKN